jgi:hypothetical protein
METRYLLPPDEKLKSLIAESLQEAIHLYLKEHLPKPVEETTWISIKEAGRLLNRSRPNIYSLAKRGIITPHKIASQRGFVFDLLEIKNAIQKIQYKYNNQ